MMPHHAALAETWSRVSPLICSVLVNGSEWSWRKAAVQLTGQSEAS